MNAALCCGAPAQRRHHPTGKDENGEYLDPDFRLKFCHDDHELVHDDFKTLEIEDPKEPLTVFERDEIRLRRLAITLSHVETSGGDRSLVLGLAKPLTVWADELRMGVNLLNALYPEWRDDPAFYPRT